MSEPAEEEWAAAWLEEVERREAFEPGETLGAEHELDAVRRRLLRMCESREDK